MSASSLITEIRRSAALAAPLVAGHVSTGLIGFVDSAIAGRHGTATLAAVAVGTGLFWLPMMIPMGTLMSLPPTVSQLDGAGRRSEVAAVFRQALWLALVMGAAMFAFLSFAPLLLARFGIAAEIVPGATAFMHGIRWGAPALALYLAMRYLAEGLHWTLPTMVLGLGGLVVLVPAGYVLTFGALGFPELGAAGLGLASSLMMWLQAIVFAIVLTRASRTRDLRVFARIDAPHWPTLRTLLATGLPIGITILMEGSLFIVTALLIGRLGATPAAAHQIAINVATLAFMVPLAVAEATTVRVGHALGRSDAEGVRRAALAGYAIVLGTQCISGLVMLLGNQALVALYTHDAAVAALAASLLLYAAMFQFPDGIQVLSAGALRGLRDTRVPMLLALLAYWAVGMPLGILLGLQLGYGPRGMWIGLIAGLVVAATLLAMRFARSSRGARLDARMAALARPMTPGPVTSGA